MSSDTSQRGRVGKAAAVVAAGGVGVALLGGLALWSGAVGVGARGGHSAGVERLLVYARTQSVAAHADSMVLPESERFVAADVERGALAYDRGCAGCHGAPGRDRESFAEHMYPRPPHLVSSERLSKRSPREVAWVVNHGLMDTGMPAWPVRRDDEVWAVTRFLERLAETGPADYRVLVEATGEAWGERWGEPPDDERLSEVRPDVVARCVECHGPKGAGRTSGSVPNLTFQTAQYLRDSLDAYANGARASAIMHAQARDLTASETEALADYFASQPDGHGRAEAGDADLVARGKEIAVSGTDDLAPCMSCHGAMERNGYEAKLTIPQLRGQYAPYLYSQLLAFEAGQRGMLPYHEQFSSDASLHVLSTHDREAVALYYASLDGEVASR